VNRVTLLDHPPNGGLRTAARRLSPGTVSEWSTGVPMGRGSPLGAEILGAGSDGLSGTNVAGGIALETMMNEKTGGRFRSLETRKNGETRKGRGGAGT
jgi:hypothetical protein